MEYRKLSDCAHWLLRTSRGLRARIALRVLLGILRIGASLSFVWLCKHLIDIATGIATGSLALGFVLMASCMALQVLLSALGSRIHVNTEISLRNSLRRSLFAHIMRSRWYGRETFHSGDMLNRLEQDVATVSDIICRAVPAALITSVQLVAALCFLAYLDDRLALIVLIIMPFALLLSKLYMKRMRRLTREIRTADSCLQGHMQENLQHRTLIATYESTDSVTGVMGSMQSGLKTLVLKRNSVSIFSSVMVQSGFALGYLTAFSWGVYGVAAGTVTFGMLTAFLQLVAQVQRPVVDLSHQIPAFINALTSAERLQELLELPLEEQGESIVLCGQVGVRFSDVSFAYKDSNSHAVRNFSHDFAPGTLTAVLGETGSGKSTLVRLMLALLLPDQGRVEVYDSSQTVKASPLTRGNFIYVPQGNTLISGTIRDNLLLGNPDATDAQMHEALHIAAADFVASLPQALDTSCGELGAGLSEGQAQRIAIARGLLRPGAIVLLDEPTSALDTQTAQTLLNRLSHNAKGKTLILITHQPQIATLCTNRCELQPQPHS